MADSPVTVSIQDNIAVVTIDSPPVNASSQAVRQGLVAALDQVEASDVGAVVLICAGRTFIAGADIREFDGGPFEPTQPEPDDPRAESLRAQLDELDKCRRGEPNLLATPEEAKYKAALLKNMVVSEPNSADYLDIGTTEIIVESEPTFTQTFPMFAAVEIGRHHQWRC